MLWICTPCLTFIDIMHVLYIQCEAIIIDRAFNRYNKVRQTFNFILIQIVSTCFHDLTTKIKIKKVLDSSIVSILNGWIPKSFTLFWNGYVHYVLSSVFLEFVQEAVFMVTRYLNPVKCLISIHLNESKKIKKAFPIFSGMLREEVNNAMERQAVMWLYFVHFKNPLF